MNTSESLKAQAKRLRVHLTASTCPKFTHAQALEAIAAIHGYADWNTAAAAIGNATPIEKRARAICITEEMSIDDIRSEVETALRSKAGSIVLRIDAGATLAHHRAAQQVISEKGESGTPIEIDSPLMHS